MTTPRLCVIDLPDERMNVVRSVPNGTCEPVVVAGTVTTSRRETVVMRQLRCRKCGEEWWEPLEEWTDIAAALGVGVPCAPR